jgi:hypothetical protein
MYEVAQDKNEVFERVLPIVERLFEGNSLYQVKLDKNEMAQLLVSLLEKFSREDMRAISEHELTNRIRKIMTLEAVSGTLNDLTPEQIEIFEAAVEGR